MGARRIFLGERSAAVSPPFGGLRGAHNVGTIGGLTNELDLISMLMHVR